MWALWSPLPFGYPLLIHSFLLQRDEIHCSQIDQILIDLKDRCGKPDGEILNLIENSKLRIIAANVGVKKIYTNHQNAMFTFNDNLTDQVYKKLIGLIQSGSAKIELKNESKITLDVADNTDKRSAVAKLLNELL